MLKHCRRGHAQTEANRQPYCQSSNGHQYYRCRACHSLRLKLKYRNDAEHREKEKRRNLDRYYVRCKAASTVVQTPSEQAFRGAQPNQP